MSRLLLALLPILLAACSLLPVPPPSPPPYPEQAEALYRALLLQVLVKDSWVESATQAAAGKLSGGDAIGMMLYTAGLLQASANQLDSEYPALFATYAAQAETQGRALAAIGQKWFDSHELATADVPAALAAIDTNGELLRYSNYLLSLGYSHNDIEMMNVRLKDELRQRLADAP